MKKYILDLSAYNVDIEQPNGLIITELFPLRKILSDMLRAEGIRSSAAEFIDACDIAKQIRDCQTVSLELNETEVKILKDTINFFVAKKFNPQRPSFILGGSLHEELIRRVEKIKEV